VYPDSWNTTTVVTLGQVYEDIISSSAFTTISAGHGWVVYSWGFIQGGSTNTPSQANDIVGYFILTNATSLDGYVTVYYDIDNGSVAVGSLTATITVVCPPSTTSTTGPSVVSLPQPPYVICSPVPGVSEVIVNGTTKCVGGPPIVVNNDGVVDFRNGTGIDLYANLTGSSFIGGTSYDTVVTLQATRFIFNAHGLIATIYPYQGKEIFANGAFTTFPACIYPISASTQYPRGTSGNGTVWFPAAGGGIVWFYPDGTCGETNG
jgi:hypothetical protein